MGGERGDGLKNWLTDIKTHFVSIKPTLVSFSDHNLFVFICLTNVFTEV